MSVNQEDADFKRDCIVASFNNQVEYLRYLGNIDLRIFIGYITLQLILSGWLSNLASAADATKLGFLLIDLSLSIVAAFLLIMNDKRRAFALATFKNIIEAMGLCTSGEYLTDRQLFAGKRAPSSLPWYLVSIIISTIGVALVLFTVKTSP